MDKLAQLRQLTTIVADTGDIESIKQYLPTDATTNPSLLLKASQQAQYRELLHSALDYGLSSSNDRNQQARQILNKLAVNFGVEILKIIPGRVSTEADARFSFNTQRTIEHAREIIQLYQAAGIDPQRILIKVASTWEGIQAARQLETEGIHCNLTLLFSLSQAIACAEAKVTLISPFVGRIMDWYKAKQGVAGYAPADDPGVKSVTAIYNYFKKYDYRTVVMGASFRNKEEILELAGCDFLTIAPSLMHELQAETGTVTRKLSVETAKQSTHERVILDEPAFRWDLNDDAMATEKLAEGIRNFTTDTLKLLQFVQTTFTNNQ